MAEWPTWMRTEITERWPGSTAHPTRTVRRRLRQPLAPARLDQGTTRSTPHSWHQRTQPEICQSVSSGCIRMRDIDVIKLYKRIHLGRRVVVKKAALRAPVPSLSENRAAPLAVEPRARNIRGSPRPQELVMISKIKPLVTIPRHQHRRTAPPIARRPTEASACRRLSRSQGDGLLGKPNRQRPSIRGHVAIRRAHSPPRPKPLAPFLWSAEAGGFELCRQNRRSSTVRSRQPNSRRSSRRRTESARSSHVTRDNIEIDFSVEGAWVRAASKPAKRSLHVDRRVVATRRFAGKRPQDASRPCGGGAAHGDDHDLGRAWHVARARALQLSARGRGRHRERRRRPHAATRCGRFPAKRRVATTRRQASSN